MKVKRIPFLFSHGLKCVRMNSTERLYVLRHGNGSAYGYEKDAVYELTPEGFEEVITGFKASD